LLLFAARPALCEEPPLVADRPGFGESASAVSPRHVQVETGVNWTRLDGDTTAADGPELLLRIGLVRSLELRLATPDWFDVRAAGRQTSGWADMAVGLKGHVAARGNDFSLRGTLYLPSGGAGFSSERLDPELAIAWSRSLSERWSLGSTFGLRWLRLVHETLSSPSLSLGRSLGRRAGTFVEYGASLGRGERPVHKLDHGYTWNPSPRTQLDVSLGIALSPAAPRFFVAAGFCHLF
jgi:hypothetical protein